MNIVRRVTSREGLLYHILPRDGHGSGRKPGYAIWERSAGGAMVYRGVAASPDEAEKRIKSGVLSLA